MRRAVSFSRATSMPLSIKAQRERAERARALVQSTQTQERLAAQRLAAHWLETKNAKYDSKLQETRGRLAALEDVVLGVLELLIEKSDSHPVEISHR